MTKVTNGVFTPTYETSTPISNFDEQCIKRLRSMVKEEQVEPIMQTCAKLFGATMKDPILVTGGRGTSQIIRFCGGKKSYICRATDATRPSFFITPEKEIFNMWAVNPLDVAPKLHHADLQTGLIIMDDAQPIRLTAEQFDDEKQAHAMYKELAEKTAALHKGPDFSKEPTNIFTDLEAVVKMADASRVPLIAIKTLEAIRQLEPILKKYEDVVPSHKDLHSNNVLYDGKRFYFIDWELGANCDRYVDLACLSIFYIFDPKHDEVLLRHYFSETPTPKQKALLFLMKQVCLVAYGYRLLRRVTGKEKIDLSKEQMNLLQLPSFKDFILENYNCCNKEFKAEELKIFPFMFLREAMKNIESAEYEKAIQELNK